MFNKIEATDQVKYMQKVDRLDFSKKYKITSYNSEITFETSTKMVTLHNRDLTQGSPEKVSSHIGDTPTPSTAEEKLHCLKCIFFSTGIFSEP